MLMYDGGVQGYPGTLIATVTYNMTREGTLRIIFEATTDKQTPVNIVQHSYFNLAGHDAGNSLDQILYINGYISAYVTCLRAASSEHTVCSSHGAVCRKKWKGVTRRAWHSTAWITSASLARK